MRTRESWPADLTRIADSEMTLLVKYAHDKASLDHTLEGVTFPERSPSDTATAARFPAAFGRALRAGMPLDEAVSVLSAEADALHRPFVEALRGLLDRLHEVKNLGSFEENARAAEEVYRVAKACGMNLIYEGQAVALECRPKHDVKAGIFRLRNLAGKPQYLYQRTQFPPLGITVKGLSDHEGSSPSSHRSPRQETSPVTVTVPVTQAAADISERFQASRQPFVEALRGLLANLHEVKNLGSFEENARAVEEINRLAKSCGMKLIHAGEPVALSCRERSDVKAGVFRLRAHGSNPRTLYQRTAFPALDLAPIAD